MPVLMEPSTAAEVVEAVRASARVVPIGAATKPALAAVAGERITTRGLSGIIEYDPSEFTFTALAGTPIKEIVQALGERGQYLPFDPMLTDAGATLGGTIASGLSGPGRFRFGGIRDFILGVQFVDGLGRLLRMGGKVVKNAAGFDLPKFLTGSMGRFGFITEATFKVFPRPESSLTLRLDIRDVESAVQMMNASGRARWELDALDILPDQSSLALRLAGPASGISAIAKEILSRWPGKRLDDDSATATWTDLREVRWAQADSALVKVPLTPSIVVRFISALSAVNGARAHISAGGNVAFVAVGTRSTASVEPTEIDALLRDEEAQSRAQTAAEAQAGVFHSEDIPATDCRRRREESFGGNAIAGSTPYLVPYNQSAISAPELDFSEIDSLLGGLDLQGLMIRGPGPLWLGKKVNREISAGVKRAIDPENRYPGLND